MSNVSEYRIEPATENDIPLILSFIKGLAQYEGLAHEVVATEDNLRESLFGPRASTEAVIAYSATEPVGFAVFFHIYFPGAVRPLPGRYFCIARMAGSWTRARPVGLRRQHSCDAGLWAAGVVRARPERASDPFLPSSWRESNG